MVNNWEEAINWVLLTGLNYVHDRLTIERRDGKRSIAILTVGASSRMTPDEALQTLKAFEF